MAVALRAVLKDDKAKAYTECVAYINHMKEQQKAFDVMVNDFSSKHTNSAEYYKYIFDLDDMKAVDSEMNMLNDALKCLQLKKELMSENVKESGNLLEVLKMTL